MTAFKCSFNNLDFHFHRPVLNCLDQDDPHLIENLKNFKIHQPSTEPYNWTFNDITPFYHGEYGQPIYIEKVIFKGQVKNGFFIEAGADDFERNSNSLFFELERGWTGLLVEPLPTAYPKGLMKKRKAWAATTCLSPSTRPRTVEFAWKGLWSGGMAGISPEKTEDSYQVQCFPLYSLLLASAGQVTVNYLSLDIEGAEFEVLKTIPWDKVDIEVRRGLDCKA